MTMTDDDKRLRKAFEFTPDDLAANRAGKLTENQITKLQDWQHLNSVFHFVGGLFAIPLVMLFGSSISSELSITVGILVICLLAIAGSAYASIQRYRKDIIGSIAESACGLVELDVGWSKYSDNFTLEIDSFRSSVDRQQFLALKNGNPYCVYYSPRTKRILSIEVYDKNLANTKAREHSSLSQQRFGEHAQNYVTSQTHAKGADLDRLLELAQPRPYWHVLDVATGGGHTALKFAPHVARVVASDLTPQMLKAAEAHITGKGITNVEFKEARAEHLPFDSNAFDLVTCRIAPHHFDDVAQFVKEAARVVRPGGLVLVQDQQMPEDPVIGGYVEAFEKLRDPSHNHALTETEWRAAFEGAGLTLQTVETIAKSHSFDEWTTTQHVLPSTKACLAALIAAAPPAAVEWLHPCDFGTPEATFVNIHIILVGRKK